MEELDHIPETSIEKDVLSEDEDSFCLSRENITSLKLLICQVSLTECTCDQARNAIWKSLNLNVESLQKQLHKNMVFFWSCSWRNVRPRMRRRVRITERRSSSCGTDCRSHRRRGRPSMNIWCHLRRGTWKQWVFKHFSYLSLVFISVLCDDAHLLKSTLDATRTQILCSQNQLFLCNVFNLAVITAIYSFIYFF